MQTHDMTTRTLAQALEAVSWKEKNVTRWPKPSLARAEEIRKANPGKADHEIALPAEEAKKRSDEMQGRLAKAQECLAGVDTRTEALDSRGTTLTVTNYPDWLHEDSPVAQTIKRLHDGQLLIHALVVAEIEAARWFGREATLNYAELVMASFAPAALTKEERIKKLEAELAKLRALV